MTLARIDELFDRVSFHDPTRDSDDILRNVQVSTAPLGWQFDRGKIDRCPRLEVIVTSTLSDSHIDTPYARSKGITVCRLGQDRAFLAEITPTAELAWGLLISVVRRIPWAHRAACAGRWGGRGFGRRTPRMLSQMSLGIVGLGRLGRLVASYGAAFGMRVYYYSPSSSDPLYERCATLLELAARSDIASIHAEHTTATERLIDREFIRAMRRGSFLINTARGALIDEKALLEALQDGHLAGAGLDVLAAEYESGFRLQVPAHPLVQYAQSHDNLLITPHYGGATVDAWLRTEEKAIDLVLAALRSRAAVGPRG